MNLENVIKHFGGTTKLCRLLKVTKGAVSQWRVNKQIPPRRQLEIEALSNGKFAQDVLDLTPVKLRRGRPRRRKSPNGKHAGP